MNHIALTQKVTVIEEYGERTDTIDQKWYEFIHQCGYTPLLLPNNPVVAKQILDEFTFTGIVLSGGNNLLDYGGDAPERDDTEENCLQTAMRNDIPVIGVCRGMQMIQTYFGVKLVEVKGHVTSSMPIMAEGRELTVNSYHNLGAFDTVDCLDVTAKARDGVIKAVRHRSKFIVGIMWHPERFDPFRQRDIDLFRSIFSKKPF